MELLIMLVAVLSVFAYSAPNFGESETLYFNYFIGRGMPKNQNAGGCPVYLRPLYYWRSLHYLHHLLCQIFFNLFIIVLLKGFTSREKQIWTRGDWIIIPKYVTFRPINLLTPSHIFFLLKFFPDKPCVLNPHIFKFGSLRPESRAVYLRRIHGANRPCVLNPLFLNS